MIPDHNKMGGLSEVSPPLRYLLSIRWINGVGYPTSPIGYCLVHSFGLLEVGLILYESQLVNTPVEVVLALVVLYLDYGEPVLAGEPVTTDHPNHGVQLSAWLLLGLCHRKHGVLWATVRENKAVLLTSI